MADTGKCRLMIVDDPPDRLPAPGLKSICLRRLRNVGGPRRLLHRLAAIPSSLSGNRVTCFEGMPQDAKATETLAPESA